MNEFKRCGNEGAPEIDHPTSIQDHAVVSLEKHLDGSQHAFVYCYVCERDFDAEYDEALDSLAALHNVLHRDERNNPR